MRMVVQQFEILEFEVVNVLNFRIQAHLRQGPGVASQLFFGLLDVVGVEVEVAKGVNERAGFEVADLGDHHGEQGIGGDVEGDAEENVSAALIKLATEFAVLHEELEERVAGRK